MKVIDVEHHFVTPLRNEAMRTNKTAPRADFWRIVHRGLFDMLGTGAPFEEPRRGADFIKALPVSDDGRSRVCEENARRLLRLGGR
jgi:predicted TIM-barrel fold metal-dependent hydrolase